MGHRLAVLAVAAVAAASCTGAPDATPTPTPTSTAVASSSATATSSPTAPPSRPVTIAPNQPTPSPAIMPELPVVPEVVRDPIDVEYAYERVGALAAGVGERIPGTDGDMAARALITDWFRQAGWTPMDDVVPLPQGGETANIVATIHPAGIPPDGPLVIVGSHMDTLGGVGANDNASGVGVLLAVADEFRDEAADLPFTLVLVAFAAEEKQDAPGRPNHLGSEQLAAALADRTVTMLSVDMVGNGPTTRIMGLDGTDTSLVQRIAAVAERDGIADVVTDSRGNVSDHGSFAELGVPAAFLWTGPDGRLHTASDTMAHIDRDDLARAGALTLALLRDLAPTDLPTLQPTPQTTPRP